jgi:CheY-like chemotaxis protein
VLVVEDIETIALLVRKTLTHAGYLVDVAANGREGLQAALKLPYDVIVADLNLPVLDGWGLLRALREDPVARESAVLVLSAHDELVDSLRAARAGARAYVKKSGRSKVLLDTMSLLSRPRTLAWSSLTRKLPTTVELRAVGAVWFLRALAELDCCGRLEAGDELSRVELDVCQGQLVNAVAQVGSHRVQGEQALEVLLRLRGQGRFEPSLVQPSPEAPWVFDAVQRACDGLATETRLQLEELLRDPASLRLNPELAVLFANVATHRQLAVLDALSKRASSFGELVAEVGQTEDEVRRALAELLRRAVLTRPER